MALKTESKISQTISAFDRHDKEAISLPPVSFRGHQRSRTGIESPASFSRTPSISPNRLSIVHSSRTTSRDNSPYPPASVTFEEYEPSNTEIQRKARPGTVGKIASWFEGTSEPVDIKLVASPKKETTEPFYLLDRIEEFAHNSIASMDNLTQRPRKVDSTGVPSANSSRFSFFKRSTTAPLKPDPDELIHMDVREALLPDGPPEITPTAYKNLQLNAESLLRRFQSSYAENLNAFRQITAERDTQADELEAAHTRSDHLKSQLCEMAEKVSDQETRISILKSQLVDSQPTVRLIRDDYQFAPRNYNRRGRVSDVSSSNESIVDSEMSSAVSIFSDAESVHTPATSVAGSPMMKHARLHSPVVMQNPQVQTHWQATPVLVERCHNCDKGSAAEAWDLVEMMRMENACLKERLAELECANDSALNFLDTLKL